MFRGYDLDVEIGGDTATAWKPDRGDCLVNLAESNATILAALRSTAGIAAPTQSTASVAKKPSFNMSRDMCLEQADRVCDMLRDTFDFAHCSLNRASNSMPSKLDEDFQWLKRKKSWTVILDPEVPPHLLRALHFRFAKDDERGLPPAMDEDGLVHYCSWGLPSYDEDEDKPLTLPASVLELLRTEKALRAGATMRRVHDLEKSLTRALAGLRVRRVCSHPRYCISRLGLADYVIFLAALLQAGRCGLVTRSSLERHGVSQIEFGSRFRDHDQGRGTFHVGEEDWGAMKHVAHTIDVGLNNVKYFLN